MYLNQHVSVVIPALNEQASIGRVIADIPDYVDQIVVVDNGSIDQTGQIAKTAGAQIVYENRKGYGSACLSGIRSLGKTDLVAFIDGDYSDFPEELTKVIDPVAKKHTGLAIGCRNNVHGKDFKLPLHQAWGNRFACFVIQLLHGYRYQDLGPMRCIRGELLDRLNMSDQNYGWTTEMQLKASGLGETVMQIPVKYRQRIGKSKISGTIKGSLLAGYKILYWTVRLSINNRMLGSS